MGVDVAIFDRNYNLVATSKTFLEQRGSDLNKHFLEGVFERARERYRREHGEE